MVALGAQDLTDVQRIGRNLAGIDDADELRSETLRLLEECFRSHKGNFFLIRGARRRPDFKDVRTRGVEERDLHLYRRYYHSMDPFARTLGGSMQDVVTTEHLVPFRRFIRTEYYNDFLKPQHIHYQMVLYLRSGRDTIGIVALFRPKDSSSFSDQELTKANLMAPWISGALERAISSERLKQRDAVMDAIVQDLPHKGFLLLDQTLEPLYWDETANGILSDLAGEHWPAMELSDFLPKELCNRHTALQEAMQTQDDTGNRTRRIEWLSPCTGQRIPALVREVTCGSRTNLLIRFEPEVRIVGLSGRMKESGLTRRETEVVLLLAQGMKNGEIADRLCIAEHTVENHLKAVYGKMKVRNRATLIHRLMEMDSAARAFRTGWD